VEFEPYEARQADRGIFLQVHEQTGAGNNTSHDGGSHRRRGVLARGGVGGGDKDGVDDCMKKKEKKRILSDNRKAEDARNTMRGLECSRRRNLLTVNHTVFRDVINTIRENIGGDRATLHLGATREGDGHVLALESGEGLAILELRRQDNSLDDWMVGKMIKVSEWWNEGEKKKHKTPREITHRGTSGRWPERCRQ
jgi:hypothetical protein